MKKGKTANKKEKEEILNELAASLKSSEKETAEDESSESGLEQDVEFGIPETEFTSFMSSPGVVKAPVLEKIAGDSFRPIFVATGSQSSQTVANEEENNDPFKYIPGQSKDEPKYLSSDARISAEPRQLDIMQAGRRHEIMPEVNQEALFQQASEIKNFQNSNIERFEKVNRFDTERAGRENSFEKEEVRHEKYKPKMPKSY